MRGLASLAVWGGTPWTVLAKVGKIYGREDDLHFEDGLSSKAKFHPPINCAGKLSIPKIMIFD
jgi:hypothetical protein